MSDLHGLIGSLIYAALVLFLAPLLLTTVLLRAAKAAREGTLVVLGCTIAPVLCGWLGIALSALGMPLGGSAIPLTLGGLIALAMLLLRPDLAPIARALTGLVAHLRQTPLATCLMGAGLFGLFTEILFVPIHEYDALEYQVVARHYFTHGALSPYPLSNATAAGLVQGSSHPPAFLAAILLGQSFSGLDTTLGFRLFQLYHAVIFCVLLGLGAQRLGLGRHGAWVVVLSFTIPLLIRMFGNAGVDLMRITLLLAVFIALLDWLESKDRAASLAVAGTIGMSASAHLLGFLITPLLVGVTLLLAFAEKKRSFSDLAGLGCLTLTTLGLVWFPFALAGTAFLGDGGALGEPWRSIEADLVDRRGFSTVEGVIANGLLRPLTMPAEFGLVFWVALLVALQRAFWRTTETSSAQRIALGLILAYGGLASLAYLASGSVSLVKNPRYWLSLSPFAILLSANALIANRDLLFRHQWIRFVLLLALAAPAATTAFGQFAALWRLASLMTPLPGGERALLESPRYAFAPALTTLAQAQDQGRVLTLRQPDIAAFAGRDWIDQTDPRLAALATDASPKGWHAGLLALGVRWIVTSWHGSYLPGQTGLGALLGDPGAVTLVSSHRNVRLYRLQEHAAVYNCRPVEPQSVSIVRPTLSHLSPILPRLTTLPLVLPNSIQELGSVQNAGKINSGERLQLRFRVPAGKAYQLTWQVKGSGRYAVSQNRTGPLSSDLLYDGTTVASRAMSAQLLQPDPSDTIGIDIVVQPGAEGLALEAASLCRIDPSAP